MKQNPLPMSLQYLEWAHGRCSINIYELEKYFLPLPGLTWVVHKLIRKNKTKQNKNYLFQDRSLTPLFPSSFLPSLPLSFPLFLLFFLPCIKSYLSKHFNDRYYTRWFGGGKDAHFPLYWFLPSLLHFIPYHSELSLLLFLVNLFVKLQKSSCTLYQY